MLCPERTRPTRPSCPPLKNFQKAGAIKRGVDIEKLFLSVLGFGFTVGVMDRLLWMIPPEECRQRFRFFAKTIVEGIRP